MLPLSNRPLNLPKGFQLVMKMNKWNYYRVIQNFPSCNWKVLPQGMTNHNTLCTYEVYQLILHIPTQRTTILSVSYSSTNWAHYFGWFNEQLKGNLTFRCLKTRWGTRPSCFVDIRSCLLKGHSFIVCPGSLHS